ncbi:MAG: GAF domain-containing sensor histidine kinase [Elainellaceae cyanobacterium]
MEQANPRVAGMMAEAIWQQQLQHEQQLKRAVHRIRRVLNVDQILQNSAIEIRQLFQADGVAIYRLNASKSAQALHLEASSSVIPALSFAPTLEHDVFVTTLEYLGSAACRAASTDDHGLPLGLWDAWRQTDGVKASVVASWGDRPEGLICLHQSNSAKTWHRFELDSLSPVAAEIAIAVEQAEQYQQLQARNIGLEAEIGEKAAQVRQAALFESTLKRITDKVRDSLDEAQILQTAVQELASVLELGGCNAALYDLEQETSTIFYEHANVSPAYRGRVAQMNNFPELYNQLRHRVYFQFCSLSPNPDRGQASLLACPIFVDSTADGVQQDVLGDLWLVHHPGHVFNEFEIRLVQQVANQCAIAIRQARLYQAARSQVNELKRLNQLKDDFLSTVSHELRTPIANVRMALRMLETTALSDKQSKYLEILESESRREATLIDDLLDMQRLEAGSVPVRPQIIHLNSWIAHLVRPFQGRIVSRQQTLSLRVCPDRLRITSDADILQRILAELLNNACKYTPAGGQIQLTCTLSSSPTNDSKSHCPSDVASNDTTTDLVYMTVGNQAQITQAELPHIFERFYRIPHADPWRQAGTGLGLALVKKLVSRLAGSIEADSYDGWTWFTVTLPYTLPSTSLTESP